MDPVTHTLIGVGMGNAFFREKMGSHAIPILAIASNLPDVDALVHLTGDPEAILIRRTFGHSLFILPILAFSMAVVLKRFWPKESLGHLFGVILLGASVHVFFDLVNSFGVVLFWPLSQWRPEFGMIFIIDLLLTSLLVLPLLICIPTRFRPYLVPVSKMAMICVVLYTAFCAVNRSMAFTVLKSHEAQFSQSDFQYIFPEPLGPHRWRGVIKNGEIYKLYLIHSLKGTLEPKGEIATRLKNPMVRQARKTPLGKRIEWFFKAPVWDLQERGSDQRIRVYDLRFTSLILERAIPFVFEFRVNDLGQIQKI